MFRQEIIGCSRAASEEAECLNGMLSGRALDSDPVVAVIEDKPKDDAPQTSVCVQAQKIDQCFVDFIALSCAEVDCVHLLKPLRAPVRRWGLRALRSKRRGWLREPVWLPHLRRKVRRRQ